MKKFISVLVTCLMSCMLLTGIFSGVAFAASAEKTNTLTFVYKKPDSETVKWTMQYKNLSVDQDKPTELVLPEYTPDGLKIETEIKKDKECVVFYTNPELLSKFDPDAYVKNPSDQTLYVSVPNCINYHYDTHTVVKWHKAGQEVKPSAEELSKYTWKDKNGNTLDWENLKKSDEVIDVYAESGVKTSFSEIIPVKPQVAAKQNNYYRIIDSVDVIDGMLTPVSAMQKWKWIADNVSTVCQDSKAVVLIEQDLDFSKFNNLKSLSYNNMPGNKETVNTPITFSIEGGFFDKGEKKSTQRKIIGYELELNKENPGFIDVFDGNFISNLNFEGASFTSTAGKVDYVGALVGVMNHGKISKVSLNGTQIKANAEAIGGLVGELINGEISNSDVKINIVADNMRNQLGGLVGNITMGELIDGNNQINEINIHDSYYIGDITAKDNTYVGGIIGNIDFKAYNYKDNVANIVVKGVYSKIGKFTADGVNILEPYGILGNIVLNSGIILPDKPFVPDPTHPEITDPTLLPIVGVKFSNVISQSQLGKADGNTVKFNPFPKEFLSTGKVVNYKTIATEDYAKVSSYTGVFDNSIWTMPEGSDHYELKYKFDDQLLKIKVGYTGVLKSTSKVIEKNNNDEVLFINGEPIVMTIEPQDGVHVQTIKAKIVDANSKAVVKENISLYNVETDFAGTNNGNISDFNYKNGNIEFNYVESKLIIRPDNGEYILGDLNIFEEDINKKFKYEVTIEFDFSKADNTLAYNQYNASLKTYEVYDIENQTAQKNDLGFIGSNLIYIQPETLEKYDNTPKTINHSHVLNIYILGGAINDYILSNVFVKSETGVEALENKTAKGWIKKGNVQIDTVKGIIIDNKNEGNTQDDDNIVWAEQYEVRLNFLNKPLHHKENIDIELLFQGRPIKMSDEKAIRIQDEKDVDLIHNNLIDARFVTTKKPLPVGTSFVNKGDKVRLAFKLTEKAISSKFIFTFDYNVDDKVISRFVAGSKKNNLKVTYDDVNKCFITDEFEMVNATEILLKLVKTKQIKIKESVGTFNPPNFSISNIPIINKNGYYVEKNYKVANITYDEKDVSTVDIPELVKQQNGSFEFTTIDGIEHEINLLEKDFYKNIEGYKINKELRKLSNPAEKLSFNSSDFNTYVTQIDIKYVVPTREVKIIPKAYNGTKGYALIANSELSFVYEYGTDKTITRVDYVSSYENDFLFEGWFIAGKLIQDVDIVKLLDLELFAPDQTLTDAYNIEIRLKPYYWLTVRSADIRMGRVINKNIDKGNIDIKYFTNPDEIGEYKIKTTNEKYKVDNKKLVENNSLITEEATKNLNEWTLKINTTNFVEATYDNYKAKNLIFEIKVEFIEETVSGSVTFNAVDYNGTPIQFYKKGEFDNGLKFDCTLIDSKGDKIEYEIEWLADDSKGLNYNVKTLAYGEDVKIIISVPSQYDISWTLEGSPLYKGVHTYLKADTRVSEVTIPNNVKAVTKLGAKFVKAQELTYYSIGSIPTDIEYLDEKGIIKRRPAKLSDANFNFGFSVSGVSQYKIQGGLDVSISADILNNKYEMVGWELGTYEFDTNGKVKFVDGNPVINFISQGDNPYFDIASIDGNYNAPVEEVTKEVKNYVIKLVIKEKIRTVTIKLPFKGITINVQAGTQKQTFPEKESEFKDSYDVKVVYGTNIVLDFVDNKDFRFVKWDNLTFPNDTCVTKTYDMGQIKYDQTINLIMQTYEAPDAGGDGVEPEDNTTIHVNAHMHYDEENARTGKVITRFADNGQVQITAAADIDSEFVKWLTKDENGNWVDFSTDAVIVVPNEQKEYAALFNVKKLNLTFGNGDIVKVAGKDTTDYGTTITLEVQAKQGYTVDKVVINGGEKVIVLGNVKKFTLYNVEDDQNISFVYRKVAPTAEDEETKDSILIMIISTVIIAIVVAVISKRIIKKTGTGRKHRKIKINID